MIIKIEGLPEGRKIKRITFDVSFEDSNPVTEVKVHASTEGNIKQQNFSTAPKSDGAESGVTREPKEIPKEMIDMEF